MVDSCRLVTEAVIAASGVLRSCVTPENQAERSRLRLGLQLHPVHLFAEADAFERESQLPCEPVENREIFMSKGAAVASTVTRIEPTSLLFVERGITSSSSDGDSSTPTETFPVRTVSKSTMRGQGS